MGGSYDSVLRNLLDKLEKTVTRSIQDCFNVFSRLKSVACARVARIYVVYRWKDGNWMTGPNIRPGKRIRCWTHRVAREQHTHDHGRSAILRGGSAGLQGWVSSAAGAPALHYALRLSGWLETPETLHADRFTAPRRTEDGLD
eukprot:86396-Chlamydomonas_euryale.AAC.13